MECNNTRDSYRCMGGNFLFPYQFFIIERLVSRNIAEKRRHIYCVKTGGYKSALIMLTATTFRDTHLIIVPLLSLHGGQIDKYKQLKDHHHNSIKVVHLDEIKLPNRIHELNSFTKGMTLWHTHTHTDYNCKSTESITVKTIE